MIDNEVIAINTLCVKENNSGISLKENTQSGAKDTQNELDRLRKENDFLRQEIGALTARDDDWRKRHHDLLKLIERLQDENRQHAPKL